MSAICITYYYSYMGQDDAGEESKKKKKVIHILEGRKMDSFIS